LRFTGATSGEEILHRDILIELGPVNAVTAPDELPLGLLGWRAMGETRVPLDRNRHRPAVDKIHDQSVIGDPNVLG
jgi:hypothetical protein